MANQHLTVLVSGASGFLATHCVNQLLEAGYRVRGTVRSLNNEKKVQPLRELCPDAQDRLELVEADLLDAQSWERAVQNVDLIVHTAAPFTADSVPDENTLIKPAVEGTMNILKAAAKTKGKVKRVVITASIASVVHGRLNENGRKFSDEDWTVLEPTTKNTRDVTAYIKAKTLAEKAAWKFVEELPEDEKFSITVLNPGFIIGPLLHKSECESATLIKRLLCGEMPAVPKLFMATIDVRDCAKAHVLALTTPEAANRRFLCANETVWFKQISEILNEHFLDQGFKAIPIREAPNFVMKMVALADSKVNTILPRLGVYFSIENSKLLTTLKSLGPLIPLKQTLADMGYSMVEQGYVEKPAEYTGRPKKH